MTYPIEFAFDVSIMILDFDGVLNSNDFVVSDNFKKLSNPFDEFGQLFCPVASENINEVIRKTGCKIVISSSWRSAGLIEMQKMWKHRKMEGEIIDVTPYFDIKTYGVLKNISAPSAPRGTEIKWWLEQNNFRHVYFNFMADTAKKCKISSYVIIDDDTDMLYEQKDNFIKIDPLHGFTKSDAEMAIKILNTKIKPIFE